MLMRSKTHNRVELSMFWLFASMTSVEILELLCDAIYNPVLDG